MLKKELTLSVSSFDGSSADQFNTYFHSSIDRVGQGNAPKRPIRMCFERTSDQPHPECLGGVRNKKASIIDFHASERRNR